MNSLLPWKRVRSALFHYARSHEIDGARVDWVMDVLPTLIGICGSFSHSRRVARDIGKVLLAAEVPEFIVPVCPAYTHRRGLYTYRGLGEGVPLLAKVHIPFLQRVQGILPASHIRLLIADQEASVPELCRAIGIDSIEFSRRVHGSILATRRLVEPWGWQVDAMSAFVPGLSDEVATIGEHLKADPKWRRTLQSESAIRADVYRKIGYSPRAYFARTVQTAAQYVHLGTFARTQSYLICNHSTQNLAWYARTNVGFLHNPVRVYDAEEPAVPLELVE